MTTSPTFADHISALTDRLDRIERALGLGLSQDPGALLQRSEALLNAERDLDVLKRLFAERVESSVDLVDLLAKLGKVQAHLLQDSIRVLGHGSPHSSVTGTPEGSDSAGSPSGDPAESCAGLAFRILLAAHVAADELDAWYGDVSSGLGGISPGAVVRYGTHEAYGTSIDDCPACRSEAGAA